jgi:hypothetical protein
MKHCILVLAGLAAISACSERRERQDASTGQTAELPDLTLPDTLSRRDTSAMLSSRIEPPVSPVEQQVTTPKSRPARSSPPARRKRPTATAKPAPPPVDSSIQAYAPNPTTDTAPAVDSATTLASRDTVPSPVVDTSSPKVDTTPAPPVDTAAPPARDTLATPTPDTTSTAAADTTVAPAAATVPPSASSAPSVGARILPIGTEIHAALDDSITSRRDTAGQTISAHVMENVTGQDGRTLIAAGAPVRLTITRIRASRSKNSQGRLALRADGIALNGQLQPVKADIRSVPRELRGRGVTGSDVAKIGGGAAAGAVVGGVVGGNTRGAVIGGVAGAAAGAVVANQTATRDVVVKAKTPVLLVLTAPLVAP